MANPLRNAMVYLGLADEDEQNLHDETPQAQQQQRQSPTAAPSPQLSPVVTERPKPAPVTPITKAPKHTSTPAMAEMNEILTVHPKAYNKDAQVIAENFRDGVPVIMNLSEMDEAEARRLIDFASGLSQGLYGKIERVTSRVFLLSPQHIAVHGESSKLEAEKEASFFQ
ncbi:cell division protein SepF [Pseudoclavibacter sp. RFBJ3]|uniref:cell division protein SepF n=1 Tax=unclassified Pseudoclavibacter TaxID=2615177 RepID=UPI000CE7B89F|nr:MULTISPECIES: cell division protein SepF [unclassified Pseudoclavibacter]MBF4458686.1 cell division protein SepF [Pseudoclavibacter sp. VKM Ac-2867]MBF4548945.1 cell division protein SepF [Pseudoclavibacter sp. VKM Ac-2888]PPF40269.1 cell division protein SepF [Pseudoclavibacter sp. AY1H1]PPF75724.1 cell division protein SepF [Pseudoclavibacter sp. Z016]PPF84329.1 cell division protein SepF [Pseudoclavibacter sp. RFBJ5]